MPQLAEWQRAHSARLKVVLVASGDAQRNRVKAAEYGLERVLLQAEHEISDAYQAHATPTAVVIAQPNSGASFGSKSAGIGVSRFSDTIA